MPTPRENSSEQSMLSALEETAKKVSLSLLPAIENHVTNEKFDARDGLDFLQTKNSLLLSYLIDLTQYVKFNLSKDKDEAKLESCMKRLREMKIILEKIRPLEKKMRYQIDKLLALSASSSDFASGSLNDVTEDDETDLTGKNTDPLAFRPNPESLLEKDDDIEDVHGLRNDKFVSDEDTNSDDSDGTSSSSEGDEDDEELMAAKAALNAGRSKSKSGNDSSDDESEDEKAQGVYRAPRLAATPFVEKEKQAEREERILKRQRDRMRKSEFLSTLKATFGDAPEEDDLDGGAVLGKQRERARRFAEQLKEKTNYEEDAMVRLTTSRKEKKLRQKIMRDEVSNLNAIADLGNIAAGVTAAFGGESKKERREQFRDEKMSSSRHANGKRRRDAEEFGDHVSSNNKREKKRANPKNSFQKALFGMDGGSSRKKKKGGKK
jgi:Cobalamin biosynthesis protein CobT (nicotinate-mononucleotide:5, 6-dimethylbenzimidazole phosphoribosyltransferase)